MINNSIYIVVVVYKCLISESVTIKSLLSINEENFCNRILIYDNSPEEFKQDILTHEMLYIRDINNRGLAYAYNKAVSIAKDKGFKWLMLLDQDSIVDKEIFIEFNAICLKNINVGIVVPHVVTNCNRIISPHFRKTGERINEGIHDKLFCINSFSIINIDFIVNVLKGFNEEFPIDMLDYYTCYCINNSEFKYYVMNCVVKHNLSVFNEEYVGIKRYESIVNSEYRYYNIIGEKWGYIFRLLFRSIKMLIHRQWSHLFFNFRFLLKI